jgi:TonB-linked SusC/RagA family outer membrane protein
MKKLLFIFLFILLPAFLIQVMGQTRNITGVVTSSEDEQPMPGVAIVVKGTTMGTVTDINGLYNLEVPNDATTLVYSFVGLKDQEIIIGGRSTINVVMEPEDLVVDEVIVTAFGTAKKGAFTGSASQINANKIELRPVTNVTTAIEGSAPGVLVTAADGQPGSSQSIRIRGFGSFSASNAPLYIVDGVQYSGSISAINPADIESLTILKDAASTALYGNKAANGVVMITTKTGRPGKGQLSVNASFGTIGRAQPEYELIDAHDYYPIMWEAYRNAIAIPGVDDPADVTAASQQASDNIFDELGYNPFDVPNDQIVLTDGTINPDADFLGDYANDRDWLGAVTRTGQRQNFDISYQGGGENFDYYTSVGYLYEEGFIKDSDMRRFTGRANVNFQATEWFKTGFNVNGSTRRSNFAQTSGTSSFVNPIRFTRGIGSIYPIHLIDETTGLYILDDYGNLQYDIYDHRAGGASSGRHIVAEIDWDEDRDETTTLGARTYGEISFLQDFKFTVNVSFDQRNLYNTFYNNPLVGDGAPGGRAYHQFNKRTSVNFNQILTWGRSFGIHNFNVTLGHESYQYKFSRLRGGRTQQVADDNTELINFVTIIRSDSYSDNYATEGYFGRLNYDLGGKYFISGSYRADGSSKFHPDNRWGDFWSVGLAWRLDQEAFIQNMDFVNLAKLRASYGQVGNDAGIDYYAYQALYSLGYNNQAEMGIIQDKLEAKNLVWESNNSYDIGLEFGFFNQLFGTIEFYHRVSDNLLFDVPLPLSSGLESVTENIGTMFNQGIEVSLSWDAIKNQNIRWNISANFTTLKNEFTKLPQEEIINGSKKLMEGRSIYDYWLREWYGVDPDDGAALYRAEDPEDADNRIIGSDTLTTDINNARYYYAGTAIPDLYGSFSSSLSAFGFDLSVMFTYQVGGLVLDYNFQDAMSSGTYGTGMSTEILNRWQQPGDVTNVPRMDASETSNFNATSSRWLTDASFLNLRHLTLAYNIPASVFSKAGMSRARVYVSGENLFLVNARKGMNVQQNFSGTTSNVYTPSRVFTIGLNVKF